MKGLYDNGRYLDKTGTWHIEDSAWKAEQVRKMLSKHQLLPKSIGEIGCGVGGVLRSLSELEPFEETKFDGYDISGQAIEIARSLEDNRSGNPRVEFFHGDLRSMEKAGVFDLLLVLDVIEHVPDYLGFTERCKERGEYKVFHIPLDIHISSVLRGSFVRGRSKVGHLHYFTAESALATLEDTGHVIIDYMYTSGALELFREHPSVRRAIANAFRWSLSRVSIPWSARVLGGYSLLVLTR